MVSVGKRRMALETRFAKLLYEISISATVEACEVGGGRSEKPTRFCADEN